ncbi:tyrosine-type recombinase/integrase [Saccharopolyspora sp. NPDC003752]
MAWAEKRGEGSWRVRYLKDDGTLGSIPGFPTKTAAETHISTMECEQRKGTWIDPAAGKITLAEWSATWLDALDVAETTEAQYLSLINNHIMPRWGDTALSDITGISISAWRKKKRATGYSESTTKTMIKILAMMLADATDENLIAANPIRPQRRGKRSRSKRRERLWATPEQVLRIAVQAAALIGPWAGLLIITAGWTGARWGELTGLQRHNTHLDDGTIVIDPDNGALHEVNGRFNLGPPKTAESARTITLPPFLISPLHSHLNMHTHPHVFVTTEGEHPRRSNFSRRAMRPAADGNLDRVKPRIRTHPVKPGLTFHGLRHSHKTWLIDAGVPEIAQARRLGHALDDDIQDIYSHVSQQVEQALINALQDRWKQALDQFTPRQLALIGLPTVTSPMRGRSHEPRHPRRGDS